MGRPRVNMPRAEQKPKAGDVCAMQFSNGSWGCFVVAHVKSARGYMDLVVYGMDVRVKSKEEVAALAPGLTRQRAVMWHRISATKICHGEEPIVGRVSEFSRERWPVPPEDGRGVPRQVVYIGYKTPGKLRMTSAQSLPMSVQSRLDPRETLRCDSIASSVEELILRGERESDLGGSWLDTWVKCIPKLDKQRCVPGFD